MSCKTRRNDTYVVYLMSEYNIGNALKQAV